MSKKNNEEMQVIPMNNRFDSILNQIHADSPDESAMVKLDDQHSIIKKDYQFVVPKGKRGQVSINDAEIIVSVDRINAARQGQDIFGYVIARELSKIAEKAETIQKMGFDDVCDFGMAMFGYKRVTVNQYARIGKYFVNDDYSLNPVLPSNMSMSAMIELLAPASDENGVVDMGKVAEWYSNGTLVDGMSKMKIRTALQAAKVDENKDSDSKDNNTKDSDSKDNNTKDNDTKDTNTKDSDSKANKGSNGNTVDATSIIDRLNDMTPDMATGYAFNALEMLDALFQKFGRDDKDNATLQIAELKNLAKKWLD